MFRFKEFAVDDSHSSMKVGTDAVLLGAWAGVPLGCRGVLDVGCGCGVIALLLAARSEPAPVVAVDIDAGSVADAGANFNASPWAPRLTAMLADATAPEFTPPCPVDLIVSNPPFFTETLQSDVPSRARARHEGSLGASSLCRLASRLLAPGGRLALIAPSRRDDEVALEIAVAGLVAERVCRVRQREGRPLVRTLWQAVRPGGDGPIPSLVEEELTLTAPDGSRTAAHARLAGPYYLR